MTRADGPDPRWLVAVPAAVLVASYLELVRYHGDWWLWSTLVHESGRLTLLETTLYASHFLGHVPVHTVLALLLAGAFAIVSGSTRPRPSNRRIAGLTAALVAFLVAATLLSLEWFGREDTAAYLLQQRQSAGSYEAGGSWTLHLPSTELQLALIPLVAAVAVWLVSGRLRPVVRGPGTAAVAAAVAATVAFTWVVAGPAVLIEVWTLPRYLAHSVRELVTFPLLYYPVPLALWLAAIPRRRPRRPPEPLTLVVLGGLAGAFSIGLAIQVAVSLFVGVDTLSQRPAFAEGQPLGVPYLLASHFFEHLLDAVFFVLAALLADALIRLRREGP